MAVSWPGSCFISYMQETLSKYTGAVWRDMAWSYRHYFLYVKFRRAKDHPLNITCNKPAILRPSIHVATTTIMLKIAKVVHSGICPWECWGCIYSIGPQHQQLPRYAPDCHVSHQYIHAWGYAHFTFLTYSVSGTSANIIFILTTNCLQFGLM